MIHPRHTTRAVTDFAYDAIAAAIRSGCDFPDKLCAETVSFANRNPRLFQPTLMELALDKGNANAVFQLRLFGIDVPATMMHKGSIVSINSYLNDKNDPLLTAAVKSILSPNGIKGFRERISTETPRP